MRNINCSILSADDSASSNGSLVDANQLVSASFHVYFGDATAAGTLKIQASNDPFNDRPMAIPLGFVPTNWVDIPNATTTVASGASALITVANMSYRWIRAVWTRSGGGSTTITVNMNALSA